MQTKGAISRILHLIIFLCAIFTLTIRANAQDTLEKIKQTGQVTVGVRESSGLAYALEKGVYVGFHTDLSRNIVADISKKLGRDIKIIYQPITSENRIPLLENGTFDFECGSTTNNKSRAKQADFAYTTFLEEVKIAVRKNSGIHSFKDLENKIVATTTGTSSVLTLLRSARKNNIHFNEIEGRDHTDSFLFLESGRADAFIMDGSILAAIIAKSKTPERYMLLDESLSIEPIACMLRRHDDNFKREINTSILRQIKDGTLERLYHRWFLEPTPPKNIIINLPLSPRTRAAWDSPNNMPSEDYPENKIFFE